MFRVRVPVEQEQIECCMSHCGQSDSVAAADAGISPEAPPFCPEIHRERISFTTAYFRDGGLKSLLIAMAIFAAAVGLLLLGRVGSHQR